MAYNCSDPDSITDGFFVIAKAYYIDGDQVYYYCKSGLFLEGNPIRTCVGSTGNWTGDAPSCTAVTTATVTTTTTTESTTTLQTTSDWFYTSIGLGSVLAILLLLLIIAILLKFSADMCRQKNRSSDYEEHVTTGCCFACCDRCCVKNCFQPKVIVEPTPQPIVKSTGCQTARENSESISIGNIFVAKKAARELNDYWRPHKHPIRDNNTSTH